MVILFITLELGFASAILLKKYSLKLMPPMFLALRILFHLPHIYIGYL